MLPIFPDWIFVQINCFQSIPFDDTSNPRRWFIYWISFNPINSSWFKSTHFIDSIWIRLIRLVPYWSHWILLILLQSVPFHRAIRLISLDQVVQNNVGSPSFLRHWRCSMKMLSENVLIHLSNAPYCFLVEDTSELIASNRLQSNWSHLSISYE